MISVKPVYRTYTLHSGQTINVPCKYYNKNGEYNNIYDFVNKGYAMKIDNNIFNIYVSFNMIYTLFNDNYNVRKNIDVSKEECIDEYLLSQYIYNNHLIPHLKFFKQFKYCRYSKNFVERMFKDILGVNPLKYLMNFNVDLGLDGKKIYLPNQPLFYKECNNVIIKLEDKRKVKRINCEIIKRINKNNKRLKGAKRYEETRT
jgi:hypothetical protein